MTLSEAEHAVRYAGYKFSYLEVGLKIREEIHVSGRMDSDILLLKDECLQVGTDKNQMLFYL